MWQKKLNSRLETIQISYSHISQQNVSFYYQLHIQGEIIVDGFITKVFEKLA